MSKVKDQSCCCLTGNSNCCRAMYACNSCAVAVLFIIFTAKERYTSILNNWDQEPISDIYVADNKNQCQGNDQGLFTYNWPGMSSGCRCDNKSITKASCCNGNNDREDCCNGKDLSEIKQQVFEFWNLDSTKNINSQQNVKLCIKRIPNLTFHKDLPKSSECPSDLKMCGSNNGIVKDSFFCVPQDQQCPIKNIIFSTKSIPNYEKVNLNGLNAQAYSLYVTRTDDNYYPLSEFKVSVTETICKSYDQQYTPEIFNVLDNRTDKCSKSSSLFRKSLLESQEKDYFKTNQVSDLLEVNPYLKYNTRDPYMLLQKNYVTLKLSCRDDIESYYDNKDKMDKISKVSGVAFSLCMIYGVQIMFFETWIGFCYKKYLWGIIIFRKKLNCVWKLLYFAKFCLIIACIVVNIILTVHYVGQANFFQDKIDKKCVDLDTDDILRESRAVLKPGLVITVIVILIYQLLIEPNVWYLILSCIDKSRFDKKEESYNAQNNNQNANNYQQGGQQVMYQQGGNQQYYPQQYQPQPNLNQPQYYQPNPQLPYQNYNMPQQQMYPPNQFQTQPNSIQQFPTYQMEMQSQQNFQPAAPQPAQQYTQGIPINPMSQQPYYGEQNKMI